MYHQADTPRLIKTQNTGVSKAVERHLKDVFEAMVYDLHPSIALRAEFNTSDFDDAEDEGFNGFEFDVYRDPAKLDTGWIGVFTQGDKQLRLVAEMIDNG